MAHWSGFSRYTWLLGKSNCDFKTEKGKVHNKPRPAYGARKEVLKKWCPKVTEANLKELSTATSGEFEQQNK